MVGFFIRFGRRESGIIMTSNSPHRPWKHKDTETPWVSGQMLKTLIFSLGKVPMFCFVLNMGIISWWVFYNCKPVQVRKWSWRGIKQFLKAQSQATTLVPSLRKRPPEYKCHSAIWVMSSYKIIHQPVVLFQNLFQGLWDFPLIGNNQASIILWLLDCKEFKIAPNTFQIPINMPPYNEFRY